MNENLERLQKLDDTKLIDVVKNYRQYGYDDQLREAAIQILAEKGIDKDQLQLTGSLENKKYDHANDLFISFQKNSRIAFIMYLSLIVSRVMVPVSAIHLHEDFSTIFIFTTLIFFILYIVYFIRSFLNQDKFYKVIGQHYGAEGVLIYLFLGMPFYVMMYFFFRNQMKDKMNEIR